MNIKTPNPMFNRPLINVGALLDVPTGSFVKGAKGEMILNGGLSGVEGVLGGGNTFKSTFQHYMMLSAVNRMNYSGIDTGLHTYDTEDNMALNIEKLNKLSNNMDYIPDEPLYDESVWSVIPKSQMNADKWINFIYDFVEKKNKSKKLIKYEAFYNRVYKKITELPKPNFIEIDSFTEFEPASTIDVLEKGDIENSNTLFMKQGLFKTKVLKDLPRISNTSNVYFFLTAHVATKINMATGPFALQPKKDLQFMRADEQAKGVTSKLYFLTTHLWQSTGATPLIKRETKTPEYPVNDNDVETDLNILKIKMLRSKSGPSGFVLELVVSQREGVLPALTEFDFIKKSKEGLDGNLRFYNLDIYPDVKLSRTTVRNLIDNDKKLRRALNITAELIQMKNYMPQYKSLYCTTKELYEDIKALGYDWDDILENTRGWWTINQYDPKLKLKFLSTLDLLRMRARLYTPYWYKKNDKKKESK